MNKFDDFYQMIERFHGLAEVPFTLCYTDPLHGDVLPINNDENFARAVVNAKPMLRIFVQRKGNQWEGKILQLQFVFVPYVDQRVSSRIIWAPEFSPEKAHANRDRSCVFTRIFSLRSQQLRSSHKERVFCSVSSNGKFREKQASNLVTRRLPPSLVNHRRRSSSRNLSESQARETRI